MNKFVKNYGQSYFNQLPDLAECLVKIIQSNDIHDVYGVGGDYAANIMKGLSNDLNLLPSSNEMHAGFSACGQAELCGISFVLTTYTVGSLPCMSAAALAMSERLPVVFISGAPGESEIESGGLHHAIHPSNSWEVDYNNAIAAFKALGLRAERLIGSKNDVQPSNAGNKFLEIVNYAKDNQQPVFIEIPRDLVFQKVQPLEVFKAPSTTTSGVLEVSDHIHQKFVESKKPLLFIGEKIKSNPRLIQQVKLFIEKFSIPYACNIFAKGIFDESSALSLGTYNGVFSSDYSRDYIENQADFILEICTSICTQDSSSAFATGTFIIDKFENKVSLKGDTASCSEVLGVMDRLLDLEIPKFDCNIPKPPRVEINHSEKLSFKNLAISLNAIQVKFDENFCFLPEIGNSFFASFSFEARQSKLRRSWLTNPWYAAMGTSIPYARAACNVIKSNNLDDIPLVVTGDGGFQFQCNELIHFLKEKHFAIIVLMRNNIFHLGKQGDCPMYTCGSEDMNYQLLIQAYGGHHSSALNYGELETQLDEAISVREGLWLIEVPCSTEDSEQSPEIELLNLYIGAKSGNPDDIEKWSLLK
ncbi:MAG: thiamine pyrophosphate-binding protein [Candidatus Cloacimonetes bacterium]|nr:thiamine pyrophosphate-binding protein [Candidatus Cloacimonadota bacterium]